jgi:SPP1 gp7 family putative phage head morphogenesis protein
LQFQIGKLSYNKEIPPPVNELLKSSTMADSAMYTHFNIPYYNPDKLYQKKGSYDLFDEMREDDQVSAVLGLFKHIILGAEWIIESENEEASEFITKNFNSLDEIFARKLYNLLTAMDYGYSLTEIIMKQEEGKIWLSNLKTRMPHHFEFRLDQQGNILEIQQNVTGQTLKLKPTKFMHFAYQGEFDNPYGKSVLNQGVYRAYWSKNAIIKFWNIYLERHGMPFGYGTYPKTAGSGAISELQKVGENIQAKTFAVFPEGFMIDFKEASKGTDNYERAIDKHNMSIARAMLVPDLLGLSGAATGGGSYSLGQEQFDMFYTIVDFVRKQIESLVTQKLVKPLMFYNFGADQEAEFKFNVVDQGQKEKMLNLWIMAVNGGKIPITDTHINWFLQNIDAPEIEQSELDEINAKKEEERAAITGQNQDQEGKPGEGKKPEDAEAKSKEEKKLTKYSEYSKRVDFKAIENELNSIEAKYSEQLADMYKLSINAMVDDIKRKQIIEKKKFLAIKDLNLKYQTKIEFILRSMIKDAFYSGRDTVKKNYIVDDPLVLNDEQIAEWIETYAYDISAAETQRILGKVKPIVTEGIRSGAGVKDIVKMIDDALQGYDTTYSKPQIETIVRTVTSSGYNEGRLQQFGTISDEIVGYEYSAILDGRETPLCNSLHGKKLKPNEVNMYNPPLHYNCRSLLVPIFKDDGFNGEFNIPAVKRTQGNFVELA